MQERPTIDRHEDGADGGSIYDRILSTLQRDRETLWAHFQHNRGSQDLDHRLVELYELRPDDLPTLTLPDSLTFVEGFSYVASHWYTLVRAVAGGKVTSGSEYFFDIHLAGLFKDGVVTTRTMRQELGEDPSGASWLEHRVRAEFRQENLSSIGARKAITGIRKIHEQFCSCE